MMDHFYNYVIARLEANPTRGERLNLAIVVFNADGLSVHAGKNLDKIRAISSALDRSVVEQALSNLAILDKHISAEQPLSIHDRLAALNSLSPVTLSAPGRFSASTADAYEAVIQRLVLQLVDPEPAVTRKFKTSKSRLFASVKAALRAEKY